MNEGETVKGIREVMEQGDERVIDVVLFILENAMRYAERDATKKAAIEALIAFVTTRRRLNDE